MDYLTDDAATKIYKTIFNKLVLKELVKGKYDIPVGDFGCLRREYHNSKNDMQADLYDCIENYLLQYHNQSYENQIKIKKAIFKYNYRESIIGGFPHEEWLDHPKYGNMHSGSSFGYCRNLVVAYFTHYNFEEVWAKLNNL